LFVQGKLVGITEAKKVSVGAQNVLQQAKRYSKTTSHSHGHEVSSGGRKLYKSGEPEDILKSTRHF
jgi:type I site-specific restriction endonuclease